MPVIQYNPLYYVDYALLRRSYLFSQALVSNLLSSFSNASWPVLRVNSKTVLSTQLSIRQVSRNLRRLSVGFRVKRGTVRAWTPTSSGTSGRSWTLHPSVQWKPTYLYRKSHSVLLGTPRTSRSSMRSSVFYEHLLPSDGLKRVTKPLMVSSLPWPLRARHRLIAFTSYLTLSRDTKFSVSTKAGYKTGRLNPYSLLSINSLDVRGAQTSVQRLLRVFQRHSLVTQGITRSSKSLYTRIGESRLKSRLASKWSVWVKSRLSKVQINWTESAKRTARRLPTRTQLNSNDLQRDLYTSSNLNFCRTNLNNFTPLSHFRRQLSYSRVSSSYTIAKFYRRKRWRHGPRLGVLNPKHRTSNFSYLNIQSRHFKMLLSLHPRVNVTNRKRRRLVNPRRKVYSVIYNYFMYSRNSNSPTLNSAEQELASFAARRGSSYRLLLRVLKRRRSMLINGSRRIQKRNKLFKRKSFTFGSMLSQRSFNANSSLPAWLFSGTSNHLPLLDSSGHQPAFKNSLKPITYADSFSLLTSFTHWLSNSQSQSNPVVFQSSYLQSFHSLAQDTVSRVPNLSKLKNVNPRFSPKYTFTFSSSPFFFLNYTLTSLTRTSDVLNAVNPHRSQPTYLVFPDSDSVKATIFRRLNRQKSLFQSRRELLTTFFKRYNKKKSQGFLLSTHQGILTQNFSSGFSGLQRSPLFIGNDTPLYGIHRLNGLMRRERLPSITPRIRRIRFKPGYGRIWRTARKSIKEILNLSVRYQYRLTPKLQKLYYRSRQASQTYSSLTLGFALLSGRFAFDRKTVYDLLASSNVFLNGTMCQNLTVQLFVNDFIQLLVNAKFYLILRLLRAGMLARRYRLNRIFFRKITSINYKKYYKTPKMSRNLPNVFFDLQYLHGDIPKYFEVDYFSLSMFVVQDQISCENWLPKQSFVHNPLTLNMYNWKYIT